ncbi:MAG: tetratricopeptide repeat protein [Nitrospinae bacterium]|nr:tetratricopeptide repeat protein [Nitrospinota bacterium]
METDSAQKTYDLILANMGLPGKNTGVVFFDMAATQNPGLSLDKKLRRNDKTHDIIIIAFSDPRDRRQASLAAQTEADEIVPKPFSPSTVQNKLMEVMTRKLADIRKEVDGYLYKVDLAIETPETSITQKKKAEFFAGGILKLAELAPWSHLPVLDLGKTLYKFRMYTEAEKMARKVISVDFGSAEAHQLLSQALKALGKIPQSIKELELALAQKPNSAELKLKLGEAYLKDGKPEKSIPLLSQAAQHFASRLDSEKEARGRNFLGQAKFEKGEAASDGEMINDGIEDLDRATRLDPGLISAYYNLVVAYQKTNRPAEAYKVFERIQSVEPRDAEGWVEMGKTYLMRHEPEKGVFAFKKADSMGEGKFEIYEEAATALYRHKLYKDALAYLAKAKRINPSDKYAYNLCGVIYRILGERFAAVDEYKMAASLDPSDAAIIFNLGVAYFKTSQEDLSLEYFRKAKELDPNLTEADKYLDILEAGQE